MYICLKWLKVKVAICTTPYTVPAYFLQVGFTMHFNCKAMPTNYTDYSCHIKVVELLFPITLGVHHTTPNLIVGVTKSKQSVYGFQNLCFYEFLMDVTKIS